VLPKQDADFARADGTEQRQLRVVGVVILNEGDFVFRDAQAFQFVGHVPINGKATVLRRGQIAKHKLRQTVILGRLPNAMNVFHRQIDFALRIVRQAGFHQPQIQRGLAAFGGDFEHVVFARDQRARVSTPRRARETFDKLFQFRRGRRIADGRFFTFQFRTRQIEHLRGLHVRRLPENLHQLRHIDEPGEARVEPVARAVRRKLHRRHRLAERRRPGIKMMQIVLFQIVRLQIPLHGEHFGHAVGDGRAGGEDTPPPLFTGLDMTHFQIHIEGAFAGRLRQTGDARHLEM
jgi:hypothetical protein